MAASKAKRGKASKAEADAEAMTEAEPEDIPEAEPEDIPEAEPEDIPEAEPEDIPEAEPEPEAEADAVAPDGDGGEVEYDSDEFVEVGDLAADAPRDVDPYVDAYEAADAEGAVVALLSDVHPPAQAERRGAQVAAALREASTEGVRAPCFPGCMTAALGMVPVFRFDRVVVLDGARELEEFRRKLDGAGGFAPRTLAQETRALGAGGSAERWRPLQPSSRAARTLTSVVDPAAHYCEVPGEACGEMRLEEGGRFSRARRRRRGEDGDGGDEGDGEDEEDRSPLPAPRMRLLPGDRVELVRVDLAQEADSFADFLADAGELAERRDLRTAAQADREAERMGLLGVASFRAALREAALARGGVGEGEGEGEDGKDGDAVEAAARPSVIPAGGLRFAPPERPEVDMEELVREAEARAADSFSDDSKKTKKKKKPTKTKGGGAARRGGSGGAGEVVRVYRSERELERDAGRPDVRVQRQKQQQQQRGGKRGGGGVGDGDDLDDGDDLGDLGDLGDLDDGDLDGGDGEGDRSAWRPRSEVEADSAAAATVQVGDHVLLSDGKGPDRLYMRSVDPATKEFFWAVRAGGAKRAAEEAAADDPGSPPGGGGGGRAFPPAPTEEEVETRRRDALQAAAARLRDAAEDDARTGARTSAAAREALASRMLSYEIHAPYPRDPARLGEAAAAAEAASATRAEEARALADAAADRATAPPETLVVDYSGRTVEPRGGGGGGDRGPADTVTQAVAAAVLLHAARGERLALPTPDLGLRWLAELAATAAEADEGGAAQQALALDAEGAPDTRRLKALVDIARGACALVSLLARPSVDGEEEEEEEEAAAASAADRAIARAQGFDAEGIIPGVAWGAAVAKLLTRAAVLREARAMLERSPMLEHVVQVMAERRAGALSSRAAPPPLRPTPLDDWLGYRPRSEAMTRVEALETRVQAGHAMGSCCAVAVADVDAEGTASAAAAAAAAPLAEAVRQGVERAVRDAGVSVSTNPAAGVLEALGADAGLLQDDAAVFRNACTEVRALLSQVGRATDDSREGDLATLGAVSQAAARRMLEASRAAAAAARATTTPEAAVEAWTEVLRALSEGPAAPVVALLLAKTRAGLQVNRLDVALIRRRMEEAKESIKREKIAFDESLDDETARTYREMRRLGIQDIDDQLLQYDARMRAEEGAAGAAASSPEEPGNAYDTQRDFEEEN